MNNYNQPVKYNFPDHYKDGALRQIILNLTYPVSGDPVDLTNGVVKMQLRGKSLNNLVFEFSSDGTGDALFTVDANGRIEFPIIPSWGINASEYKYDLKVTDSNGIVYFFIEGLWKVNQNVTEG